MLLKLQTGGTKQENDSKRNSSDAVSQSQAPDVDQVANVTAQRRGEVVSSHA